MDSRSAPKKIILAVKALLLREGRALIIQRSNNDRTSPGIWEFAGGGLEFGETPVEAILREIKEETGLDADIGRVLYTTAETTSPTRHIVVIVFLCQAHAGRVCLSSEHQDFRWVTKNQLMLEVDKRITGKLAEYGILNEADVLLDE